MNLPLFLARRIYTTKGDKNKVSRPAIRIATLGVAVGLAVMILTVSVIIGFKNTIRDKVVGFGSHIQVTNFLTMQSTDSYPVCIDDSMMAVLGGIEGIAHVERYALTPGILKTDDDFLGITFKGIAEEYDSSFIKSNLIAGDIPTFTDSVSSGKLLISEAVANKLHLSVGDKVFAYFVTDDVRARRFVVSGVYHTNMAQFDDMVCFTDLYTTVKLNKWKSDQCTGAELRVADYSRLDDIAQGVVTTVNRSTDRNGETFTSRTIDEAYPQIFSWLDLLDTNVWIIIILMICVAGFTMISGLLIIILERTRMIGILKALGASNTVIRHTFLWFATFIIGWGMLIGNVIGIGLTLLQQAFGLVELDPEIYYVSVAPMEINLPIILLLNIATLTVSVLVLIAPSFMISHIHPAKSMHYE